MIFEKEKHREEEKGIIVTVDSIVEFLESIKAFESFSFSGAFFIFLLICIYISASSNNIIKIIILYNYVNSFKALLCCGETELGGKGKA